MTPEQREQLRLAELELAQAELEELQRLEASRSLAAYVSRTNPGMVLGQWQLRLCLELELFALQCERGESPRLLVFAPPQHGKAVAIGEALPTLRGMRNIEEINAGDYVIGSDGRPTRVVAATTWQDRELYRVTTDDGHSVVVDGEHDWTVRLDRKHKAWTVRTTAWLAARQSPRAAMIPMARIIGEKKRLPVSPYLLGAWLGDGNTDSATISKGVDDLRHIATRIAAEGHEPCPVRCAGTRVRLRGKHALPFGNKHIPEAYFTASIDQRMALLQGLVDTDGYVSPSGQVEYCSVLEPLARGVARLVHTLGVKASVILGRSTLNGMDHGPKYRVMFYMRGAASLPRKAQKTRDAAKKPNRYITIEKLPERGATRCIQVEAADHLYLVTQACIVTHNSTVVAKAFPAWLLSLHPGWPIILASYASSLAESSGRWIRNTLEDKRNLAVFPDAAVSDDNRAVGEFAMAQGGQFLARGVGGGTTGRPARVFIIDDPFADREEAESPVIRGKVKDWYYNVALTRLAPGGGMLIMHCMTGETLVRRPDGTETPMRDIRPGDQIATCDRGRLSTSTVRKWVNQGSDDVLAIRLASGRLLRANARHPFLVQRPWGVEWVRVASLKPTDLILRTRDTVSGPASSAPETGAIGRHGAVATAPSTTRHGEQPVDIGRQASVHGAIEGATSSTATGSPSPTSRPLRPSRATSARSVSAVRRTDRRRAGRAALVSTIAIGPGAFADSCVTIATLSSGEETPSNDCWLPSNTCDFTPDAVVSITADGREDVFDIEVDRTENFIANGCVSHNTRWHQEDLAGVVLDLPKTLPGADVFRVLKFQALDENDKALHEERYTAEFLKKQRDQMSGRDWNSIYQQEPISEKGDYFKPADLRTYDVCPARGALALSFDLALKTKQENDCCAISAFGCSADGSVVFGPRIVNERMDILASCKLILEMAIEVDAIELVTEAGNIEGAVGPLLRKMMSELDPPRYWPIWTFPPRSDKKARARSLQGRAQAGRVLWPSGVMFETVIKPQFLGFGAVKHDDLVDMAAQACLYLDRAQNQKTKAPEEKTPLQIERERKRAIIKRGLKRRGADAESEAAQYRLFAGEKADR